MLEQNQKELDGLMNKYQGDLSGLQQKRTEVQAAQAAFMAEFKRLKKDVIWPTLIDIGNYLNRNFSINERVDVFKNIVMGYEVHTANEVINNYSFAQIFLIIH